MCATCPHLLSQGHLSGQEMGRKLPEADGLLTARIKPTEKEFTIRI